MERIRATVRKDGFWGTLFPVEGERGKVILTFSGSDGGMTAAEAVAEFYQAHGIAAMAVGLFKTEQTGRYLDRVPLEYARRAIEWLHSRGYERIGADGISKGSEYVLAAACRFSEISCVIVRTPSHFVSEGLGKGKRPSETSCWSYQGRELPFTQYRQRKFNIGARLLKTGEYNILPYNRDKEIRAESLIPVERIQAPILMLSAKSDTVWPSEDSCRYMEKRLKEHGFASPFCHISYEHISHFMLPMRRIWLLKLLFVSERKYPAECAQERQDMNEKILQWVREVWK